MRIAFIVPPFIPVPPHRYGGTELFIAHLARGLRALGHWPVVYTVGESEVECETRWRKPRGRWPLEESIENHIDDLDHTSWACEDAARDCDIIHLNNAPGLNLSRYLHTPIVYTLHHPHVPVLSQYYRQFTRVQFVAISHRQAYFEEIGRVAVVHHGIDTREYRFSEGARDYLCFLGRIAPIKGVHTAISVARRTGIPLRIAGEIQPAYRDYWEQQIRPQVDGRFIQYVGEVDLEAKNQLFAGARSLLFPIDWEEPFGLVMLEAMACGVPVLALPRGSAVEVVVNGKSGWICRDETDMVQKALGPLPSGEDCRAYVESFFGLHRMTAGYADLYRKLLIEARHAGQSSPEHHALAS